MADEQSGPPSLHIDTDWKKQAQEEKRRLAEQAQQRERDDAKSRATGGPTAAAAKGVGPAAPVTAPPGVGVGSGRERAGARSPADSLAATFEHLVQSVATQALYYLGDLAVRGAEPSVNLDGAKLQHDLLTVLEQKTSNNLSAEEQKALDQALYEVRTRYVSVASQYL